MRTLKNTLDRPIILMDIQAALASATTGGIKAMKKYLVIIEKTGGVRMFDLFFQETKQ